MFSHDIWTPLLLSFIAGFSTFLGSGIFLLIKKLKNNYLGFLMGLSAGVMIYFSFMELLPQSISHIGLFKTNLTFFAGFLIMSILDFLIPHEYIKEHFKSENELDSSLMKTGIFVTVGMIIHKFPEGMAIALSSMADIKLGILVTIAIALHNIPEGIAVAVPIYYATRNAKKAVKYTLFSGMVEPLGAVFTLAFFQPFLNTNILSYAFAFIAGLMIFISFDELIPCCFQKGEGHGAVGGIILGMFIIAVSITIFAV
jgi:ZIP family zinc transporter